MMETDRRQTRMEAAGSGGYPALAPHSLAKNHKSDLACAGPKIPY